LLLLNIPSGNEKGMAHRGDVGVRGDRFARRRHPSSAGTAPTNTTDALLLGVVPSAAGPELFWNGRDRRRYRAWGTAGVEDGAWP